MAPSAAHDRHADPFGGFASTVCWPFSAFLRRAFRLAQRLPRLCRHPPLRRAADPPSSDSRPSRRGEAQRPIATTAKAVRQGARRAASTCAPFVLMASAIALCSVISSVDVGAPSDHPAGRRPVSLAAAVCARRAGRAVAGRRARRSRWSFGRYYHPIWTMLAATLLVTVGARAAPGRLSHRRCSRSFPTARASASNRSRAARCRSPSSVRANYAALMGRIAMPSLIAQAVSPSAGAVLLQYGGVIAALSVLTALAALNVALVVALRVAAKKAALPLKSSRSVAQAVDAT